MTDFTWPLDLKPLGSSFKLQSHTGGSESPFSRQSKIYELSAPRWTCSLSFNAARGSRWGRGGHVIGDRLDGIIAQLRGRANRIALWDFDFELPRGVLAYATGNLSALQGATSITITGLPPGGSVLAGDYVGGDGRPHLIVSTSLSRVAATVDSSGHAVVTIEPQLSANIAANAATFERVTGMFRLASDDQGDNFNEAGQFGSYSLQFVEDL